MNTEKLSNIKSVRMPKRAIRLSSRNRQSMDRNDLIELYKVNYFYDMVRLRGFSGMPERKENIMERLESRGQKLTDKVLSELLGVFEKWLAGNAMTDPGEWAEARLRGIGINKEALTNPAVFEVALDAIVNEYMSFAGGSRKQAETEIFRIVADKSDVFDRRMQLVGKELASKGKELGDDAKENIIDVIMDSSTLNDVSDYIPDLHGLLLAIYEHAVYPLWYAYHGKEETEGTRANNEAIVTEIKQALSSQDLSEKFVTTNKALNVVHVSGTMLDYIDVMNPGINKDLLLELSDIKPDYEKGLKANKGRTAVGLSTINPGLFPDVMEFLKREVR